MVSQYWESPQNDFLYSPNIGKGEEMYFYAVPTLGKMKKYIFTIVPMLGKIPGNSNARFRRFKPSETGICTV